jgi:hypothetical protein
MDAVNLKKDVQDNQVFEAVRYNADQKAVEDAINLLTQSAVPGNSGADNVLISPVSGTSSTTVMELLTFILSLGTGTLPADGAISNAKLATDVKIGSLAALTTTDKSSVVNAIIEIVAAVAALVIVDTNHAADTTRHTSILTTEGDMMSHNGTTRVRIAKGTARKILAMNAAATTQEWIDSMHSLLTATGDIVVASAANSPARLAVDAVLGKALISNGTTVVYGYPEPTQYTPSNDILLSAPDEIFTVSTTYAGLKSFRLSRGGLIRVDCDIKISPAGGSYACYVQLYNYTKQSVIAADVVYSTSDTYSSKTFDTTVLISPMDLIQIQVKALNGNGSNVYAFIKNIVIKGTQTPIVNAFA